MLLEEESFGIIPLKKEEGHWKVLLILHAKGNHWAFPKGHRDAHETPMQAAIRELKEETGLDIERFLDDISFVEEYQFRKKMVPVIKKVTYFPALVTGELNLQEQEIRDAKWLLIEDAIQLLTFDKARAICSQLKNILPDVV